jgi:hypothetical protein
VQWGLIMLLVAFLSFIAASVVSLASLGSFLVKLR